MLAVFMLLHRTYKRHDNWELKIEGLRTTAC